MTAPLPGLGGPPYRKIEGEEYQELASRVHDTVFDLLNRIHFAHSAANCASHGDGGPVIQGALGGILQFALLGPITDDELTETLNECIRVILPQLRMAQAAGFQESGRA